MRVAPVEPAFIILVIRGDEYPSRLQTEDPALLNLGQAFVSASQFGLTPFDLARPASMEDIHDLLSLPCTPCYLAGGTDMFIQFREGLRPDFVIDLNGIAELADISLTGNALIIGAGMRHSEGACHGLVDQHIPGFTSAWSLFGNTRVQGMGTLGGNLMARRERYEGPILASALDVELTFLGPDGQVTMSMEDVWANRHPEGALLTHISVPVAGRPRLAYDRTLRPIFTLAAVLQDAPTGGIGGRAVMGFEWDRPVTFDLELGGIADKKGVTASAPEIAATAFERFPEALSDAEYKKDAGTAVLTRLLTQLGAQP